MTDDNRTDIELIGTPGSNLFGVASKPDPAFIQGLRINGIEVDFQKLSVESEDCGGFASVTVTVTLVPSSLQFVMPDEPTPEDDEQDE